MPGSSRLVRAMSTRMSVLAPYSVRAWRAVVLGTASPRRRGVLAVIHRHATVVHGAVIHACHRPMIHPDIEPEPIPVIPVMPVMPVIPVISMAWPDPPWSMPPSCRPSCRSWSAIRPDRGQARELEDLHARPAWHARSLSGPSPGRRSCKRHPWLDDHVDGFARTESELIDGHRLHVNTIDVHHREFQSWNAYVVEGVARTVDHAAARAHPVGTAPSGGVTPLAR